MDVLGAMCIKDDGNLCREEKDQSVSTGLGNIFRHPFTVFVSFKDIFFFHAFEYNIGGVSIQPFF